MSAAVSSRRDNRLLIDDDEGIVVNNDKHKTEKLPIAKKQYVRRSIELHPEVEELLDVLQEKLKARSHTEVLQKAIQLLAVALGGKDDGKTRLYISKNDSDPTEIIIL